MKSDWKEKLPQHTPSDMTWAKISDELLFETFLNEKKRQLPQHQPANTTWDEIEQHLPTTSQKHFSIKLKWIAAASILLFISVLWFYDTSIENIQNSYSTASTSEKNEQIERVDINEIDRRCNQIKALCKRPEIKELREEIKNLDEENTSIEEQLKVFGEDVELMAAQQRIRQKKAELAKEIIELMNNNAIHS